MTENESIRIPKGELPKDFRTEGTWGIRDVVPVKRSERNDPPTTSPWPSVNSHEYDFKPQETLRYLVEGPMPNGKRNPEMSAGMSKVFRAWDLKLQQVVFLKFVDTSRYPTKVEQRQYVESLEREAKMLARVEGAAKVYDFFYTTDYPDDYRVSSRNSDPIPVIVMEYIPPEVARPLSILMSEKAENDQKLDLPQSFFILKEVARIMDANNAKLLAMQGPAPKKDEIDRRKPLVMRDVKPSNILVGKDTVRVIDYGVTQDIFLYPDENDNDEVLSTPKYIPPEIALGQARVDERADIYSLGVIALELFTGKNYHEQFVDRGFSHLDPAAANDVSNLVVNAAYGFNSGWIEEYLAPTFTDKDIRLRMVTVFEKVLSRDANNRYKTNTEFIQALLACFKPQPERS